jgi:hypothetical protein
MHARTRTRGRVPAALLSLCLGLASACSDEPAASPDAGPPPDAAPPPIEVPLGASLPPLEYTLALTYADRPYYLRPQNIAGHLYLDIAADGQVAGVISAVDTGTVGVAMISGRVEGGETVVLEGQIDIPPDAELGLEELRFVLLDSDGDGAADAARGQASGSWMNVVEGDIVDQTTHTSTLTAGLDTTAPSASLFVSHFHETLAPFEAVTVHFHEPLREADVRDNLRILAGGTALTGELTIPATGGLVTSAAFQPDVFLPFGTEVTIDLGNLKDPSGNALLASDAMVSVAADPGLLTDNAGFESEPDGWLALGWAGAEGEVEGFAPVEGAAQGLVSDGGTLAAVLDVAADATALELSFAAITTFAAAPDPDHAIVIGLRKPGGELIEIFDLADEFDQLQDCVTCAYGDGRFVGPLRRTLDLTPHRGQRVFLTVEVHRPRPVGEGGYSVLLVDDIQVR